MFERPPNSTETTGMCPHGNFPASCEACRQEREKTFPKEEAFNKSRFKLVGAPNDERGTYYRQKFQEVLQGLDTTVDHQLLNSASVEFISVEPSTAERPDGTIVINIARDSAEGIVSRISQIINLRGQTQKSELHTVASTEKHTSEVVAPEPEKIAPEQKPSVDINAEQGPQHSIETDVASWEKKYGIRLSHMGSKINPETFSINSHKLDEVFQRVITEKEPGRLERSSFTLVDSGGSRYKDGEKYIDITDEPQKIFELLVRHTGSGR